MNKDLFFWNKWDSEFKHIYISLLALLVVLLGSYFVILYHGYDIALDWLTTTRLESKPIILGINNIFDITAPISTNLSVLQQYYEAGAMKISPNAPYVYLAIFILGLAVCLTVVTYLGRFFFLTSTALFIFLLFLLKFDGLELFGLEGNTNPIIFFLLFVPLSYYFHEINKEVSLRTRLLSFIGLTILSGIIIHFFATVENPFLLVSSNIFIPAVLITIIFILLIGYEVVYTILIVTTYSGENTKTNNTKHFIILTIVYILNLVFAYMRNAGKVDWDIYYINAFVLFAISTVLGIWGIKDREILYQKTLPFYPYTGLLYIALAIISLSTIGYHIIQANDPILEAFEDAIIFGHIGFGFMFMLYIIGNFISLLMNNLPVYKIAFKEDNFPYVSARLAGLITAAAFFFLSNYAALNQSISGYFINMGDFYQLQNNKSAAIKSYQFGSLYANINHKSNYMLSHLLSDEKRAHKALITSTHKKPTPHAYVNAGLSHLNNGKFFDALFTYQEGISRLPHSDQLKNNLAVLYASSEAVDSAAYYFNTISDNDIQNNLGLINKLSLSALKAVNFLDNFELESNIETNRLDINANILAKLITQPDSILRAKIMSLANAELNLMSYAYLNNLGIWTYSNQNANYLDIVESAISNPNNEKYKESLLLMKSLNLYNAGRVSEAYITMNQLISLYKGEGMYAFISGLWSIEQGAYKIATEYLMQSITEGYHSAKVFYPIGLWLDNQPTLANEYVAKMNTSDTLDSRINVTKKLLSTDVEVTKSRLNTQFKNVISVSASNVLDEITIAESRNDTIKTYQLYTIIGTLNPFFTEGILSSVNYFNEKSNHERAYEIIVNAMEVNPYSEDLVKSYINQCFIMGFDSYAETGLLKLLDILSKEAYDNYEILFDLKKDQLEQEDLNW